MAGSGWRDWVTGELVEEADFQGYVQDQVVGVFADATARDAAITAPAEGMHAYLSDNDVLTFHDGTAWRVLPAKPTQAGDITYFDGTKWVVLPIGSAGQVLRANTGSTAPEWVSANTSAMVLEGAQSTEASTTSTTAVDLASVSGLSISNMYPLIVIGSVRGVNNSGGTASVEFGLKLNSTTLRDGAFGVTLTGGGGTGSGGFWAMIPPRFTSYLRGSQLMAGNFGNGTAGQTHAHLSSADAPTASITSVTVRARCAAASMTAFVDEIYVYSLANA